MTPIRSILILLCCCSAAHAQCYFRAPAPVVRVANAVKGACNYATGTVLHDDGTTAIVVTSWHLVRDDGVGTLSVYDHVGRRWIQGTRLAEDPSNELFALRVRSFRSGALAIADAEPAVGAPVVAGGYGTDGTYRACTGRVTSLAYSLQESGPDNAFAFSGEARQGDSGGPILNTAGKICGLLWGTLDGQRYGTRLPLLRAFLCRILAPRSPGVLPGPADDVPRLPLPLPPRSPSVDIDPMAGDAASTKAPDGAQSAPAASPGVPEEHAPTTQEPSMDLAATARDALGAALPWLIYAALGATGIGLPVGASMLAAKGLGMFARWRRVKAAAKLAATSVERLRPEPPAEVGRETPPLTPVTLGWRDSEPVTRNRYVRVEHSDLLGEAYKQAIARFAESNPQSAGFLKLVEGLADQIWHGLRAKQRRHPPQLDTPVIYPQGGCNV